MNIAEDLGLPADFIVSLAPQGTDEWLEARLGVCTGSRAKDARSRLADKPEKIDRKTGEITPAVRGGPSSKQSLYAKDLARAREGGRDRGKFATFEMREGQAEEPNARMAYEERTGCLVEEVGFICTPDRKFGVSVDGLRFYADAGLARNVRGAVEIKTMLSSDTLFDAMVFGDYSEYIDQIQMSIWLLSLDWVDLVLWAPDLEGDAKMKIVRIERDDDYITELTADLMEFDGTVEVYRQQLRSFVEAANGIGTPSTDPDYEHSEAALRVADGAPITTAAAPKQAVSPTALPELF